MPGDRDDATRPAEQSLAQFDSATTMLKGAAAWLHGRSLPAMGAVPRPLAPVVERLIEAARVLPRGTREWLYRAGSGSEAVPAGLTHTVSAEAVARWMVDHYPPSSYQAAIVGSSSGALVHLAAALGVPFLPQTFLVPVEQREVHPDDPEHGFRVGLEPARRLLAANPDVALHHMHDPNQDRLSLARMTYFRLKRLDLGAAYRDFLTRTLPRGATLLVSDCRLRWPVTRVDDRHVFQFGALGGLSADELHRGSDRIAAYLRRYRSPVRRWDPPAPDDEAPEAEWGFDARLLGDLEDLAERRGWRLRRLVFELPEDLSPLSAELYRWWYRRSGLPADDLLVESFVLMEPTLTIRTGSVPYWSTFPVDSSADALERYLDTTSPYDRIRLTLFNHGTDGVGVAPVERWQRIVQRARCRGELVGVSPRLFPRDFAAFGRFHRELERLPRREPPEPLTLEELEEFLRGPGGAGVPAGVRLE